MTKFPNISPSFSPDSSFWATRGNSQTSRQTFPGPGGRIDRHLKAFRRHGIIGLLYTLLGFSLISTISFWSVVSHGVALRSRSVNLPSAEAQARNFSNRSPSTAGPQSLQWQDVVGHLDVGSLFAIKPAHGKDDAGKTASLRKTLKDANIKTENDRPFFITRNVLPQTVCPELVIPGLVEKKALDLQDLSMNQSEVHVLGEQLKRTHEATGKGNRQLQQLVEAKEKSNETISKPILDSLSQLAVKVGNHSWLPGGHWKPTNCLPRWKVAIIIPFRDRAYHLPIILKYITPMLRRQLLEFAFYVVEQNNSLAFNRAMLMNVGFLESLNFSNWDCFIFHDVDHIPLSDLNYYGCSGMPRHFLSGADRWKYKLPYDNFFGAVSGLTAGNIRQINGFPNVYWGWGGEDDEIWERVREAGLPVSRAKGPHGFYNVITHHHKSAPKMKERMQLLKTFKQRHRFDGLNNLKYKKPHLQLYPLYTVISVDIQKLTTSRTQLQPAPPAKKQQADKKEQPKDKLKDAKKAVENGKVNSQSPSEDKKVAAPAVEDTKTENTTNFRKTISAHKLVNQTKASPV